MSKTGAEIDKRADAMVRFINGAISQWNTQRKKDGKPDLPVSVAVSRNPVDRQRTPAAQAKMVAQGTSWTCNSSHMTNSARHVYIFHDGKIAWSLGGLKGQIGTDEHAYLMSLYAQGMKKQGLNNFKGKPGFLPTSGDPYHVELPGSRTASDSAVKECVVEYKTLIDGGKGKVNKSFEKNPAVKKILSGL